jgi:hypothetical protein
MWRAAIVAPAALAAFAGQALAVEVPPTVEVAEPESVGLLALALCVAAAAWLRRGRRF